MKKLTLTLSAILLLLTLHAQQDSTRLDAGYVQLQRSQTPTITIKGSDLEKMPFANLSEALTPWLYGAYTSGLVQYIVDGVPVSDVNAYSIFDIEEVVLVQNAAVLASTAGSQQQIVLIRTKHHQTPKGITAAVQTGPVSASTNGMKTDHPFYENYYLGAWRNIGKVSMSISANYLRDVMPLADPNSQISDPYHVGRWRLNATVTWNPDRHQQIDFRMLYAPQTLRLNLDSTQKADTLTIQNYHFVGKAKQSLINPQLRWTLHFGGFTNEATATYMRSAYSEYDTTFGVFYNSDFVGEQTARDKSSHFWARDRVEYSQSAGAWKLIPSITMNYEHFDEQYAYGFASLVGGTTFPFQGGSSTPSNYYTIDSGNLLYLTPALDITWRRTFYIQGGTLLDISHHQLNVGSRQFPFASLSIDPIRLASGDRSSGFRLTASYAQLATMPVSGYPLTDLNRGLRLTSVFDQIGYLSYIPLAYNRAFTGPYLASQFDTVNHPVQKVWQVGASYSGWNNRLTVSYSYQLREFRPWGVGDSTFGPQSLLTEYPLLSEVKSTLHHIDIRATALRYQRITWVTDLNLTLLRNKVDTKNLVQLEQPLVGDVAPYHFSKTGGWVNRLTLYRFTAGLDLLYHFGETTVDPNGNSHKLNSVMTPNIYAGYHWPGSNDHQLELFLDSRGLIQNSSSDLLDKRRYYTIGGKLNV
jgi:hypothetical protein